MYLFSLLTLLSIEFKDLSRKGTLHILLNDYRNFWLWQNLLAIIIGKKDDKYVILL